MGQQHFSFWCVFFFWHNGNKWPCCCSVRFSFFFFFLQILHPWLCPWRDPDPGGGLVCWWRLTAPDCVWTVLRLFHSFIQKRGATTATNQEIIQNERADYFYLFFWGWGGKTDGRALHCGQVSHFLPACPVLDACMLVFFFFFLKNVHPHPGTAALKREQKTLVRVLLDTMNLFLTVSSMPREGKPAEQFHLKWLFIARLKRDEAAGEVKGSKPNTLDLCFDQRFSRRPVDVSQVPPARCTGSHPCTWSGLETASRDACTGPSPVITLCLKLARA